MLCKFAYVVALMAATACAQNRNNNNNNNGGQGAQGAQGGANGLTLLGNAVQSASTKDGSGAASFVAAQAKSLTSTNNFINFCSGKTLTNGLQVQGGSCNGIVMGDIPSKSNMVSSIITFPTQGGTPIAAGTTFDITVQMANLVAGTFTNADETYYSAPQQLQGGKVVGHTHVTVQDLGNTLNPKKPLDATQFAFFKGINDAGNGNGLLKATVTGGLPAGNYRVCTLASASNHQLVLMPVAQRGTADDCTKFVVGAATGGGNAQNNQANANKQANAGQQNNGQQGQQAKQSQQGQQAQKAQQTQQAQKAQQTQQAQQGQAQNGAGQGGANSGQRGFGGGFGGKGFGGGARGFGGAGAGRLRFAAREFVA